VWNSLLRSAVNSKRRERRSVRAQLNALLFVRIVVKTVYFVATKLFIRLKRLTTVVTFKGIRRLTSSNVAPHFRVCDSFFLMSHSHSLTRLKINASFEFRSSRLLLGLFRFSNHTVTQCCSRPRTMTRSTRHCDARQIIATKNIVLSVVA
jgi:hypothetical protein